MSALLDVQSTHLKSLDAQEAVEIFGQLLMAEARSIGMSPDSISVPLSITVADGGVDATVQSTKGEQEQGLIRFGINCYQVKSGNTSPRNRRDVRGILFQKGTGKLHRKIKQCLEQKGFFAVVLFGSSLPTQDVDTASLFKEELQKECPEYNNPRIAVWQQEQIKYFLQKFPSLQKRLTRIDHFKFRTHAEWRNQSQEMQTRFVSGTKQQHFIDQIRKKLEPNGTESSIRIIGSPGSGKTRIVYEITQTPELSSSVLYFESPDHVYDQNFLGRLLESDAHAILIVDECDESANRKLQDRIALHSSRIKLITIDNGQKRGRVYDLPPLNDETIINIISGYGIPRETSTRCAPLCTPSPRLANWLGENLRRDPDFSIFSEDEVYSRFIAGRLSRNSPEFKSRKQILMWISLFVKVGFDRPYNVESEALAKKIKQKSDIPENMFFDIVRELRQIKILQGHSTLYITPSLLHFWLWREWWQTYGNGFDLDDFLRIDEHAEQPTYFPQSMHEKFLDMFRYAPESSNAMEVVYSFLRSGGLLEKNNVLKTDVGGRLFSALAEADPRQALNLLNRTVGKWDQQELLKFGAGRREILWSLEGIVYDPKNFRDSAKILLCLAAAENEDVANNATGIFTELFSMAPKELARTQASIGVRLDLLRKVLDSSDKEKRMCALKACDKALESLHFAKIDYKHGKILTTVAENWKPGRKEICAYRKIVKIICSRLDNMNPDERQEAIRIIVARSRALTRLEPLSQMITDKINELYQKPYTDKEKIIDTVETVIHYDRELLDPSIIRQWEELRNKFQKNDYQSLMKRHVGMNIPTDDFSKNQRRARRSNTEIKMLAQKSLRNRKKFMPMLNWICTSNAKNAHKFGYELGQMDIHFSLLDEILNAQPIRMSNYSPSFFGNYLTVVFEKDVERWESVLDFMTNDPDLCRYVTDVTSLSGMTDRAGLRILGLHSKGVIKESDLATFVYRPKLHNLSEAIFLKWMQIFLDTSDPATINTSLALFEWYYIGNNAKHLLLPEQTTLCLITHNVLLKNYPNPTYAVIDEFCWTNIAKKFIEQFPKRAIFLANIFLKSMQNKNNIFDGYDVETLEILNLICALDPSRVWSVVKKYVEPPLNYGTYKILTWMEGSEKNSYANSPFMLIPIKKIFSWIDADPDQRARHVARFIPKILFDEEKSMLRGFLIKYGDREDVCNELHARFLSGGWSDSGVQHYSKELGKYIEFKKHEKNPLVSQWIDDHIESLRGQIERQKAMEERLF